MTDNVTAKIESYLFYTGDAVSFSDIASACNISTSDVKQSLSALSSQLEDRGVSLILHNDTARLVTAKEYSDFISKIQESERDTDITDAQAEALSVVAYLAPVQKVTVDFIRGVNSRTVLRNLLTRGLIHNYAEDGTTFFTLTSEALGYLGITDLAELPDYKETRRSLQEFIESDTEMSSFVSAK